MQLQINNLASSTPGPGTLHSFRNFIVGHFCSCPRRKMHWRWLISRIWLLEGIVSDWAPDISYGIWFFLWLLSEIYLEFIIPSWTLQILFIPRSSAKRINLLFVEFYRLPWQFDNIWPYVSVKLEVTHSKFFQVSPECWLFMSCLSFNLKLHVPAGNNCLPFKFLLNVTEHI